MRRVFRYKRVVGALGWLAAMAGCQQGVVPNCTTSCTDSEFEPNDTFQTARVVAVPNTRVITLIGDIDVANDVDVFDLGAVVAGDRIEVALQRIGMNLRSALALYDEEGELINEDTLTSELFAGSDPAIEHVVRADTTRIYAAVSHTSSRPSRGAYEVDVRITRGGAAPAPVPQAVVLSFAGGVVDDPLFGRIDAPHFDAGDINPIYAGATAAMKAVIRDTFEQNYARFEVEIWGTDDPDTFTALAGRSYARVVFGGFNSFAFGAAQSVDTYNQDTSDAAIIFTESFEPELFPVTPSAESLAVAIGNVAAHEMGHLLGLNHVVDATAIMDESSPAFTLLADQEFKSAPLSSAIFPLGRQDSADLLGVILGLRAGTAMRSLHPSLSLTEMLEQSELHASWGQIESSQPVRGKCLNCLWRQALNGHGPLKDMVRKSE